MLVSEIGSVGQKKEKKMGLKITDIFLSLNRD